MKKILFVLGIAVLASCSLLEEKKDNSIYLQHSATGEFYKCRGTVVDDVFSSVEMCARNREQEGYKRLEITKKDFYGNPVEYKVIEDPYWPKEQIYVRP